MSLTAGPGTTPTARRERTRRRLMEAAVAVIAQRGVNGASVEEICERAGFTRGAFYSNFASKEDLCLDVLRQHHENHLLQAERAVASVSADAGDTDRAIETAIDLFVDSQDTDVDTVVTWSELRLHAIRTPEMRRGYLELEQQTRRVFTGLINRVVEDRGFGLLMPASEVGTLLGAVFEQGLLESTLQAETDVRQSLKRQMATVLRALLVTPEDGG